MELTERGFATVAHPRRRRPQECRTSNQWSRWPVGLPHTLALGSGWCDCVVLWVRRLWEVGTWRYEQTDNTQGAGVCVCMCVSGCCYSIMSLTHSCLPSLPPHPLPPHPLSQIIEGLYGVICQKVCAASQFSLVLTAAGQVRCPENTLLSIVRCQIMY